jgi:hypothetical protein
MSVVKLGKEWESLAEAYVDKREEDMSRYLRKGRTTVEIRSIIELKRQGMVRYEENGGFKRSAIRPAVSLSGKGGEAGTKRTRKEGTVAR